MFKYLLTLIVILSVSNRNKAQVTQSYSHITTNSYDNVEIINYYTFGPLAVEHAQIEIRNKNNYDVIVSIELKQNDVWNPCQLYSGTGKTDMDGYSYSEDFSEYFKVKANSIRLVGLVSNKRGRPTDVRIKSVR